MPGSTRCVYLSLCLYVYLSIRLFESTKVDITNSIRHGVKIFDMNKPTCLATDWSRNGTGFILRQKHCQCVTNRPDCCDNCWKIVYIGGQFNNTAEANYAPIEGECLAVVKALHKTRYFILGCPNLIIATDHKPLLKILGDRQLQDIENLRLLRLKEKTLRFFFRMVYVFGRNNTAAHTASRHTAQPLRDHSVLHVGTLPVVGASPAQLLACDEVSTIAAAHIATIGTARAITLQQVQDETVRDTTMRQLLHLVQEGFPRIYKNVPPPLRCFSRHRLHLCTADSVVLYKDRVVIPPRLRASVLDNLHSAHQGVASMTLRAEQAVFWPGLTRDIERTRAMCATCNTMAPSQANQPPSPLVHPAYPFQMVCSDYFSYGGSTYVVIVDRYSNWPVVALVKPGDGAQQFINALKIYCHTYGIPDELSTDGGTPYTSSETQQFLRDWGIHHRISSVAFPHSNTRAELGVKTMKRLITGNTAPDGRLNTDAFHRAMLNYKNTPDQDTKVSPAQIVFGRQLRDFIPSTLSKLQTSPVWRLNDRLRELALDWRHSRACEHLSARTLTLPPLRV